MEERNISELYPGWTLVKKPIGTGSCGTVYEIEQDMLVFTERAALKHIRIPRTDDALQELLGSGYDAANVAAHFDSCQKEILREYGRMSQLRGHPNVVSWEDPKCVRHEDGCGWDVFVKMELLMPLMKSITGPVTDRQVIKLGVDLGGLLQLCRSRSIIHGDIKPQNIFLDDDGNYKLGDFGVARAMERSGGAQTGAGGYPAPEVCSGQSYGTGADLYSLGMVMYWMLNDLRLPFLPDGAAVPTKRELEQARKRRISGEALPEPKNGSPELKRIVLKACAFDPEDRYADPAQMLSALRSLGGAPEPDRLRREEFPEQEPEQERESRQETKDPDDGRKRKTLLGGLAGLLVLAVLLILKFCGPGDQEPEEPARYVMHSGRCYYVFDEPVADYEAAAAFCRDLGGCLADVTSREENLFLQAHISDEGYDHVFLGASDAREDGVWEWESGAPFEYQNWNEGEPNNDLGGEDNLAVYRILTNGGWNDIDFATPSYRLGRAVIAEVKASSYCVEGTGGCAPEHLADGDPQTRWCPREGSTGVGESLEFTLEQKARVIGIVLRAAGGDGYCGPRKIRMVFPDGTEQQFVLQDRTDEQELQLDRGIMTGSVKVVFEDMFSGRKDDRIAVAEIGFLTEERKTGFVCEWESEAAARAGMKRYAEKGSLGRPLRFEESSMPQVDFAGWTDVDQNSPHYDAVLWVSQRGIMNGTAEGVFEPEGQITRGQMVVMLWRAAGKPVPSSGASPFRDVPADSPYYDAVLWAVEEGIAGGMTADTFEVGSPCTRDQAITFLYRTAGKPETKLSQEPFEDVGPEHFFYEPVLWAYENSISSGISATQFGVDRACTRLQAAIMLYRTFAGN